jgi:hypothetical protein
VNYYNSHPYNQNEEISKMMNSVKSAFGVHERKLYKMLEAETYGNNNTIVLDKLTEIISILHSLCESFLTYLRGQINHFDHFLSYYREILSFVLSSYASQLEASRTEIEKIFPCEWPEDDFYSKEIKRVKRLIEISQSKN